MNWYLNVLKKYAEFSGRARRTEYWMFVLFNSFFLVAAMIIDNIAKITLNGLPYGYVYILYSIVVLIPGLAVTIRRLHDIGKSGRMIFIVLVPLVGAIWLLVLLLIDSHSGENEYGENPKSILTDGPTSNESVADDLLLFAGIWILFSRLFWSILPRIVENLFSSEWFKLVNSSMFLITAVVPISIAFAAKNKKKRMTLFILSGVNFIVILYEIMKIFI